MLEWALRKAEIPEVLVRSVMSLYEGAKTGVGVDSELSVEFEVEVRKYKGPMLLPFLFAMADLVTGLGREVVLSELVYADDLVDLI